MQQPSLRPNGQGISTSPHLSGQLGRAIGNAIAAAANSDNITATQVTCTRIPRKPIFPLFGIFPRRGVRENRVCAWKTFHTCCFYSCRKHNLHSKTQFMVDFNQHNRIMFFFIFFNVLDNTIKTCVIYIFGLVSLFIYLFLL